MLPVWFYICYKLYHISVWYYDILEEKSGQNQKAAIAIPENNASNPAHQSVKSCVRYLCRASARLQIPSLSFALC